MSQARKHTQSEIQANFLERTESLRLAAIVESSDDAIVSKTLDGFIQTWNTGAERLFGYSAEEAIGKHITLIIPPDHIEEEKKILERLRNGERIEHFETIRMAKDGRRLDISLTVSPLRDEDGRLVGASKVARDVTERKRVELALRDSEERYKKLAEEATKIAQTNAKFRAFFEQGTNFAGVLTLDGILMEANRLSLDACGFKREDVIGKYFWECGWWRPSSALQELIRTACASARAGEQFRTETTYFVASGEVRMADLILAPVTDDEHRVIFIAATGTDVTERRRMEDALREADRKKDDFIALLGHELRNPLAPIRNGLQMIRLAKEDPKIVGQVREMMERQVGHMVRLIDDLLDIARIGLKKMELRKTNVLLSDVISEAVEVSRQAIDDAGHQLDIQLPKEPVYLHADLTRLAQVFGNLLSNSAKYTPNGGKISLRAEQQASEIVISVEDNGIGIPAQALPGIFDMFSQVDRTIERTTGGLGIGLALVKGLVEMHNGKVSAFSEGNGKGSTFTLRLPIGQFDHPKKLKDAELADPMAKAGRRILVVDDNEDSARSMAALLEILGNEVKLAHNGAEAIRWAKDFHPDVILMDLGMPMLNGYEAAKEIRKQPWGQSAVIVAMTGWGQASDREKSRLAGFDGHLVKPVMLADLEAVLAANAKGSLGSPRVN